MKGKKFLSLLLALVMCIGMIPLQVLAEGEPEGIPIDEAHFPDPVFRQVMTGRFGTDGVLSEDEIVATKSLSTTGVKSLKGIEYFTDLEELRVTNHKLTFIDLSNNTQLKYLSLSGTFRSAGYQKVISRTNNLSHLDLSKNVNLEELYLNRIAIEDLDLSNNTRLQMVDVRNTITIQDRPFSLGLLKSVNFGNNPNLKTVVLTGNKLSELDLSGTPNIEGLHLGYNAFKDLDISSLPKIKSVSADGNQIVFFNPSDENFQTLTNYELKKQHRYVPIDANKLWDPLGPDGDTTLMEGVKNLNYGSTKDYKFWFNYTFDDNKTPRWMTYNYSVGDKRTLYQTSLTPYNQWTYGMKLEEGDEFLDASQVEVFADGVKVNDPFGTARFKAGQKITLKAKDGNTIDRLTISRTSYIGLYENPDIQEGENNEVTFTIRNYDPYLLPYKGENTHTITYDKGDGDNTLKQAVVDGKVAEEPAKPSKEGFSFAGWYTDATFENEYKHDVPVTEDMTLYAKWEEIRVTIDPTTADVVKGGNQSFTATVENAADQSVTWSVEGNNSTATTIDAEGKLTVGADETATSLTVKATSLADTTKTATATVTVKEPVGISVSPATVDVVKGGNQSFTATVENAADQSVNWSVEGNNSDDTKIDAEGKLTVGADETATSLTVKATSVEDTTKTATATVTVKEPVGVSVSPAGADVVKGGNQSFTATVENAADTGVTWSVEGNTSADTKIDADGKLTVGADETATSLTVKATSVADNTKTATATVTVKEPVGISVSPATADVVKGGNQSFTATVENATDTGVNWSVEGNTSADTKIDAEGKLTVGADETATSLTVKATWVADNTKTATATVTVKEPAARQFTVTFNVDGGSALPAQTVVENNKATRPANPTREGFAFKGWYRDEELTNLYDFETPVTADLTLYAKWEAVAVPDPEQVIVSFNSNGGSSVGAQTIDKNNKATRPANPTREGFAFKGWYRDEGLTNLYDFETPVTADLTLYAKWQKLEQPGFIHLKPVDNTPIDRILKLRVDLKIDSSTLKKAVEEIATEKEMDTAPFIKDGRTMLPIRFVAEALDFDVDWIEETRTVVLRDKTYVVEIPVDTHKIIINGTVYESDVKPIIRNDRTMLPIANVARALGLKDGTDIIWKEETREVIIIREVKY